MPHMHRDTPEVIARFPWLADTVAWTPDARVDMHSIPINEMGIIIAGEVRAPPFDEFGYELAALAINLPMTRLDSFIVNGRWTWAWQ